MNLVIVSTQSSQKRRWISFLFPVCADFSEFADRARKISQRKLDEFLGSKTEQLPITNFSAHPSRIPNKTNGLLIEILGEFDCKFPRALCG